MTPLAVAVIRTTCKTSRNPAALAHAGTILAVDECIHGMNPEWCGICKDPRGSVYSSRGSGLAGVRTKQDELDVLTDQLGLPRAQIGEGSSIPSHVFDEIRNRYALPDGSMPEVAEAAATAAGLPWSPDFDSRGSRSGGGSTVTFEGMIQLNRAVALLESRRPPRP